MARDSRYTAAAKLAQNDMQAVIDSFGEDAPFMSDGASARTEARRARLANDPRAQELLARGYTQGFVERLLDGSAITEFEPGSGPRSVFIPDAQLDPTQVLDWRSGPARRAPMTAPPVRRP